MNAKTLYIIVLVVVAAVVWQEASAQTTTRSTPSSTRRPRTNTTITTESTLPTTTDGPSTCPPITRCNRGNPIVCGRNGAGTCRRFRNICALQRANCAVTDRPAEASAVVSPSQCRNLRVGAAGRCNTTPILLCPRRPVRCRPGGTKLCVRNRDGSQCRVMANACMLRNLNCHSRPRNNWLTTNMSSCRNMCAGEQPKTCTLPTKKSYKITLTALVEDAGK